jgi:hypothetical protein
MTGIVGYGRFRERLDAVMPHWDRSGTMPSERFREHKAYTRRLKAEQEDTDEGDRFEGVDFTLPVPQALEWWDLPFDSFVHDPRLYWTDPEWPPAVRPDPSGYGVADGLPESGSRGRSEWSGVMGSASPVGLTAM